MAAGPSSSRSEAPPREGPPQEQQEFLIGKQTLAEYFDPKRRDTKITRGELAQIIQLFPSKGAVADGMHLLEFNLRRSIRQMIAEESKRMESLSEGGIILPPGS